MAFNISGNNIEITRGDTGIIEFIPDNYEFSDGDILFLLLRMMYIPKNIYFKKK